MYLLHSVELEKKSLAPYLNAFGLEQLVDLHPPVGLSNLSLQLCDGLILLSLLFVCSLQFTLKMLDKSLQFLHVHSLAIRCVLSWMVEETE